MTETIVADRILEEPSAAETSYGAWQTHHHGSGSGGGHPVGIETFRPRFGGHSRLNLLPLWRWQVADAHWRRALADPWGPRCRPDWAARGLLIWPRGGQWRRLRLRLPCPRAWRTSPGPEAARARLALRWWAEAAELRVDGEAVHHGDLFDTSCRWELPLRWWAGAPLELELRLCSPRHDDGALLVSRLELEPLDGRDPLGLLAEVKEELVLLRQQWGQDPGPGEGVVRVLGHAHLDLAWLWPVADTWRAAERTFASALALMERHGELHFGHSTPALYAWLEQHRPTLFAGIRRAMEQGRWEPLNGPWVENDCVLISTASLLRQFRQGQLYSQRAFPEWSHPIAWLPDSFGFAAGLPAVAASTGVRWFCTHKLAWNATNPFPHRLFRWRSRCGGEVLALMTAPIGTDGDPLAIERERLAWRSSSGCSDLLWLPGVGDHGGGPTREMLEQLQLWNEQPEAAAQRHGTLRTHLSGLESLAAQLPVWRDELYLELHRGCATSHPDQKRHNRSLERLLREDELVRALGGGTAPSGEAEGDWQTLLFHQFHDILPGTAIPEVFEQAEPRWRQARRQARRRRDGTLRQALVADHSAGSETGKELWWLVQLQPLPPTPLTLRLPRGEWTVAETANPAPLPSQDCSGGGQWVQLPGIAGVDALALHRRRSLAAGGADESSLPEGLAVRPPHHPVSLTPVTENDPQVALQPGQRRWRLGNGLIEVAVGPGGVEQVWTAAGEPQLAGPVGWHRWGDRGEFWDAWDIPADYRDHPLPWTWQGAPQWIEQGPLCCRFLWRGSCGRSPVRLDGRLLAGRPWLELTLSVQWRQHHELLRMELPLLHPGRRWAADTSGGVIERPLGPLTAREQERWEVPVISWAACLGDGDQGAGGMAVVLDGPQGVGAGRDRLGVSLLRSPTWPDPGADHGWQRVRLALMPCPGGWRRADVPREALRLREPIWLRPSTSTHQPSEAAAGNALRPFPALGDDQRLVDLRPCDDGSGDVWLTVQNEGPCRRGLKLGPNWRVIARCDGLDRAMAAATSPGDFDPLLGGIEELKPWELGFFRLGWRGGNVPCGDAQSS